MEKDRNENGWIENNWFENDWNEIFCTHDM